MNVDEMLAQIRKELHEDPPEPECRDALRFHLD
jgi:hypothetical protein